MITYNDIYEALRKEKYAEQLQALDKKFIQEVSEYLKEKQELADKKEDLFSDAIIKTKKQLENAVSIFKELILRRKKKILNLAFIARETGISKADFENMIEFEREMFEKIVKGMEDADKEVSNLLNGRKENEKKHVLINFKENVEEFLNVDGEMLGPFEKGEVANLPEEIVKILVDAGKVEVVEE
jgi:DNA replication initiation complex subunit (GINS family)